MSINLLQTATSTHSLDVITVRTFPKFVCISHFQIISLNISTMLEIKSISSNAEQSSSSENFDQLAHHHTTPSSNSHHHDHPYYHQSSSVACRPWARIIAGKIGGLTFPAQSFSNKKELYDYMLDRLANGCPCNGFDKIGDQLNSRCPEKTDFTRSTADWLNRHYKKLLKDAESDFHVIANVKQKMFTFPVIKFFFCTCGSAHK